MLYTLGFAGIVFGLIGAMLPDTKWELGNNSFSLAGLYRLVPVGAIIWLIGLGSKVATAQAFFGQAFRDLLYLMGAAILLRALAGLGRYAIPAALIAAMGIIAFHNISDSTASLQDGVNINNELQEELDTDLLLADDGELLVELSNDNNAERWKRWIGAEGWTTRQAFTPKDGARTDLDDYWLVDLPADVNWESALEKINHSGLADWVEPNEVISLEILPTRITPPLNRTLGVNDPGVKEQWALGALQAEALYDLLVTRQIPVRKRALVAILDTGVDAKHEDLQANYRSINKKYDNDPKGHGTHCAGIAGAVTDNGIGVASLARNSNYFDITSVKVLRAQGSGTQKDIIAGIIEAVDAGADVLSMSLGGFSTQARQRAYSEAVRYATDKGAIVVAAAGNSNRDAAGYTPVNAKGMIGVSAVDQNLQRAGFSNRVGRIKMAVAAPGVGIYSTKPNNNYNTHNGTSMATPFVSGLLGIMKSIRPDLTAEEAFAILNRTGIATQNTSETGKLIQPASAVEALLENAAFE